MKKNKLKLYAIMIFVLLCTEVHCQKVAINRENEEAGQ